MLLQTAQKAVKVNLDDKPIPYTGLIIQKLLQLFY